VSVSKRIFDQTVNNATNHREDSSENADLLGRGSDVVVPVVVSGKKVEHDLYQPLASNFLQLCFRLANLP
jgi:hypothetical protein